MKTIRHLTLVVDNTKNLKKDKCTCATDDQYDLHSCPYQFDVNNDGDETHCSCCDYCTRQCADDV